MGDIDSGIIFMLHTMFGKDLRMFSLIEGSAEEAHTSVEGLVAVLTTPQGNLSEDSSIMEGLREARNREKVFAQDLERYMSKATITPIDREDVESLSTALYKIPKTAAKFGDHYITAGQLTCKVDMSRHLGLLDRAADMVRLMVGELRRGANLEKVKAQNEELGQIEGEADKLMISVLQDLYSGRWNAVQVLMLKDLFELLEKVYDRCRDAGNVVFRIALKQS